MFAKLIFINKSLASSTVAHCPKPKDKFKRRYIRAPPSVFLYSQHTCEKFNPAILKPFSLFIGNKEDRSLIPRGNTQSLHNAYPNYLIEKLIYNF